MTKKRSLVKSKKLIIFTEGEVYLLVLPTKEGLMRNDLADLSNLPDLEFLARTTETFIERLRELSKEKRILDLRYNQLGFKKDEALHRLFQAIPSFVEVLILSGNQFHYKSEKKLHEALKHLPHTIKEIDLSCSELLFIKSRFCRYFYDFRYDYAVLRSRFCRLLYYSRNNLVLVAKGLPPIERLNLTENDLRARKTLEIIAMFKSLPTTLKLINLSGNGFQFKSPPKFYKILNALPQNIQLVDLRDNYLKNMGSIEEVGNILIKVGKRYILGNCAYEKALKRYINSAPIIEFMKMTSTKETPFGFFSDKKKICTVAIRLLLSYSRLFINV